MLAALRHVLGQVDDGVLELSRPWRDGVWLGLPLTFGRGREPVVRLPLLSAEALQLDAAAAKLSAAYLSIAPHDHQIGDPL